MEYDEFIKYTQKMTKNIETLLKSHEEELDFWLMLVRSFNKICEERNNLEQALSDIEEYTIVHKENPFWGTDGYMTEKNEGIEETCDDILEIIQKSKGDVKNENNNI